MDVKPARIQLHIEELVLHGFAPGDRYRIAEAVQQELGRLLKAGGLPGSFGESHDVPRIEAAHFSLRPNSRPESAGTQAAKAVYRAIRDGPNP